MVQIIQLVVTVNQQYSCAYCGGVVPGSLAVPENSVSRRRKWRDLGRRRKWRDLGRLRKEQIQPSWSLLVFVGEFKSGIIARGPRGGQALLKIGDKDDLECDSVFYFAFLIVILRLIRCWRPGTPHSRITHFRFRVEPDIRFYVILVNWLYSQLLLLMSLM